MPSSRKSRTSRKTKSTSRKTKSKSHKSKSKSHKPKRYSLRSRKSSTKQTATKRVIKIRLSGGATRQHLAYRGQVFGNKTRAENFIRRKFPNIHFVFGSGQKVEYILYPSAEKGPSASAVADSRKQKNVHVMAFDTFIDTFKE